jgi:hypothetical protein
MLRLEPVARLDDLQMIRVIQSTQTNFTLDHLSQVRQHLTLLAREASRHRVHPAQYADWLAARKAQRNACEKADTPFFAYYSFLCKLRIGQRIPDDERLLALERTAIERLQLGHNFRVASAYRHDFWLAHVVENDRACRQVQRTHGDPCRSLKVLVSAAF